MKIINNKQKALQELKRISQRTSSGNNKKIDSIVEEILQEVKIHGDKAIEKYKKSKNSNLDENDKSLLKIAEKIKKLLLGI